MPQIFLEKAKSEVTITPLTKSFRHGEGPVWDERTGLLYFVDAFDNGLARYNPKTQSLSVHKFKTRFYKAVGTIFPTKESSEKFVVGLDRGLYEFEWKKNSEEGRIINNRVNLDPGKEKNQVNDGKVDKNGHIWQGTLTREDDLSVVKNGGSLYRIYMPQWEAEEVLENVSISNGIAWTKDDKYMFHVDSENKTIEKYDFDLKTGELSNKRVLFRLKEERETDDTGIFICDGMTIDTDDNLWVAIFGGYRILNIDAKTGTILRTIEMPARYVTSCCWGGPNLDILYATTSTLHSTDEEKEEDPRSGSLFEIKGLGKRGFPCNKVVTFNLTSANGTGEGVRIRSVMTVFNLVCVLFILMLV